MKKSGSCSLSAAKQVKEIKQIFLLSMGEGKRGWTTTGWLGEGGWARIPSSLIVRPHYYQGKSLTIGRGWIGRQRDATPYKIRRLRQWLSIPLCNHALATPNIISSTALHIIVTVILIVIIHTSSFCMWRIGLSWVFLSMVSSSVIISILVVSLNLSRYQKPPWHVKWTTTARSYNHQIISRGTVMNIHLTGWVRYQYF